MTDWASFAVRRIRLPDVELAVRVGGQGAPLVLLHGFPQHSLMWHAVAPRLAERFTVIVPDQRGQGGSGVTGAGYTKTALARDVAAMLDALGHERANVAGYDLGAGVAVAFARDYPTRVIKLAVMEFLLAGFGMEKAMAPTPDWNLGSNWHFGVFTLPDLVTWLFAGRERELLEWFFWHKSHGGAAPVSGAHLDEYTRALSRPGVLRAGAGYYASVWQDAADNASLKDTPLAMPVLAVGGESAGGPFLEKTWAAVASDLQTEVIRSAGHWLGDENPSATADALMRFFAGSEEINS